MPHTNFDISKLALFDKDGCRIDLERVSSSDGEYMSCSVFFGKLSVALYDNHNFYMLSEEVSYEQFSGDVLSSTDYVERNFLRNVSFPNTLALGDIISECASTSVPTPHLDWNQNPNGIAWSPLVVAGIDYENGGIRMSKPALAAGAVDFQAERRHYQFPGANVGDSFTFRWVKKSSDMAMSGFPALESEDHAVGDRRIWKNRLYRCITAYLGGFSGNSDKWVEISANADDNGFFTYDVSLDGGDCPYIEKVINKRVVYDAGCVGFRYPLEFNVAFNPSSELEYSNTLEVWYTYCDDGTSQKILEISVHGEGVMEDERVSAWLLNYGIKFNKYDAMMLREYDLREALPDWKVINSASKRLFFNKEQVFPYIGTYRGLSNMIAMLGFEDLLHVKEYWVNKDPDSAYFDKMLLIDISDMLSEEGVRTANVAGFNRSVKFDSAMRKTGYLALSYSFTVDTGDVDDEGLPILEDVGGMTQQEVFYKLEKIGRWLKENFLPVNVVICDMIGEYAYFQLVRSRSWNERDNVFDTQYAETARITSFPSDGFFMRDISALFERHWPGGAPFPAYTFNAGGSDPFENGQSYPYAGMSGLSAAIRAYYSELDTYDMTGGRRYWEYGDDGNLPVGCPTILTFEMPSLTVSDLCGRALCDFVTGGSDTDDSISSVQHQRTIASPLENQWTAITINDVIFGHSYVHELRVMSETGISEYDPALTYETGMSCSHAGSTWIAKRMTTGAWDGFDWEPYAFSSRLDVRQYTYVASAIISVVADDSFTSFEIEWDDNIYEFQYPGSTLASRAEIAAALSNDVNSSGLPFSAEDGNDGTFRLSATCDSEFDVTVGSNCMLTGDTAAAIAAALSLAISADTSLPAIISWLDSPPSSTYYVAAAEYGTMYVDSFGTGASYYTVGGMAYLNMYEIEWNIVSNGGPPYSFTRRGPLHLLREMPHVFPYACDYDVWAKAYDFSGGATIICEPRLVKVVMPVPDIIAMSRMADKFSYSVGNLTDATLLDFTGSEIYYPNAILHDPASSVGNLRKALLNSDYYRRSMYAYDYATSRGTSMWDSTIQTPGFVPLAECAMPRVGDWGLNRHFRLSLGDFPGARVSDMYFWRVRDAAFGPDFLAGFRMWDASPFDRIVFGRNVGSPYVEKLRYVCPQFIVARCATTVTIDVGAVNVLDGIQLVDGDVVLVKNQYDETENGVYVAHDMSGYFSLVRDVRCDTAYKNANAVVILSEGDTLARSCWRTSNYEVEELDDFLDTFTEYYRCDYATAYDAFSDYLDMLCAIVNSERHEIMSLFSAHAVYSVGSPQVRQAHFSARAFDRKAYQYLSYVKNFDTSVYSPVPAETIDGNAYSFCEPSWAYSSSLMDSLESEYPMFMREELFLFAPLSDVLSGATNDIDYFVNNGCVSIENGTQEGYLPSALDDDYMSVMRLKAYDGGFFIPKHSLVFFGTCNTYAIQSYEWTLTNDVTGEELARVTGVPFFVWKFNTNTSYRVDLNITDAGGNSISVSAPHYVHVMDGTSYAERLALLGEQRKIDMLVEGSNYGSYSHDGPSDPDVPSTGGAEGIGYWIIEYDFVVS